MAYLKPIPRLPIRIASKVAMTALLVLLTSDSIVPNTMKAQTLAEIPEPEALRVLPGHSVEWVDEMLRELEIAYAAKDLEGFIALFAEDFRQVDLNRRIHIAGRSDFRRQTVRLNAAHRDMGRIHHGRALIGESIVVEVEWTGTVRGEAIPANEDRSYRYDGIALMHLNEAGLVDHQIIYADFVTLAHQLGLELP